MRQVKSKEFNQQKVLKKIGLIHFYITNLQVIDFIFN